MKNLSKLFVLSLLFFILFACADSNENEKKDPQSEPLVYELNYELTVINNTSNTIKLYDSGFFSKHSENVRLTAIRPDVICDINGRGTKTCRFSWSPKHYYDGDLPYTSSFYLKLTIDTNDYYLAGWLSSDNGKKSDDLAPMPPSSKIVQNGIGWAENNGTRAKNGVTYIPFTVHYDGGGYKDFDDTLNAYAKATLTINSKADITFVTTSLQKTK